MNYEEGTVGFLIEELNKIKDKNKKVYWVETQYDEYDCYGDGFTTTFHLVDGFGEEAIKDGIVLGGERIDYIRETRSEYWVHFFRFVKYSSSSYIPSSCCLRLTEHMR